MSLNLDTAAHRGKGRSRPAAAEHSEGFLACDADCRFTECSPAAEQLLKTDRRDLIGRSIWDVAELSPTSPFGALMRRVASTREPEDAELTFRDGRRSRLLTVRAFPIEGGTGAVWHDITAVRAAERRVALSVARYREVADGIPTAAWLSRADGKLEFVNQAMADALGRPPRALLNDGWIASLDPADQARALEVRAQARAQHSSFQYEGRFRRPDGRLRVIQMFGRPRFDPRGGFLGHVGIASDITEAREQEERQRLLINELNHRVKNTLATVQSLVRGTLRDRHAPGELESEVTERLVALSAAHDVLSRGFWEGADLGVVVGEVLRPYAKGGRIAVTGPDMRVAPKAAIAVSMGIWELVTNAAKHGALSVTDGRVALHWTRDGDAAALEWRETGGPRVTAPERTGFGSLLLGRVMAGEMGSPPEITYAPEGLIYRIRVPVAPPAPHHAG